MASSSPPHNLSAHKAQLTDKGYTIIPNVLSPDECASTLERLWAAASESRRRGNSTFLPHLDPNASNVRVFYLLELDEVFRDLIQHPVAVEMVQNLLGEEFLISNFTANIARPGSGSMGLHR